MGFDPEKMKFQIFQTFFSPDFWRDFSFYSVIFLRASQGQAFSEVWANKKFSEYLGKPKMRKKFFFEFHFHKNFSPSLFSLFSNNNKNEKNFIPKKFFRKISAKKTQKKFSFKDDALKKDFSCPFVTHEVLQMKKKCHTQSEKIWEISTGKSQKN